MNNLFNQYTLVNANNCISSIIAITFVTFTFILVNLFL